LRDNGKLRARVFTRKGCGDAIAGMHRQLYRFLFVVSSCAQCRHDVARSKNSSCQIGNGYRWHTTDALVPL
jgi:hypothetical protein